MKSRLELPFDVLSDSELALASALGLPTFQAGGMALLKRLTLIVRDGVVAHVFFPIEEPSDNAFAVLKYLQAIQEVGSLA
jgi:peroxiredoxin